MKTWFKPLGWFYLPVSLPAMLITLILLAAFIHDFIFIDQRAHSISDLYYNFAPYGFMYFAIWMFIGAKASKS
ncbi:hypothetical protein BH11BAC2_BH11BAC2_07440 [soil metagenome]